MRIVSMANKTYTELEWEKLRMQKQKAENNLFYALLAIPFVACVGVYIGWTRGKDNLYRQLDNLI